MAKSYTIISGKGGVGKTTTAVNLGAALNNFKENVVIVDANILTPNLGLYLGAPVVPVSLNHVLQGKAAIGEAIYEHESGTKIVPCSLSPKDSEKIDLGKLKHVEKELKKITDHIIFDSAAGLGEEAKTAMNLGDEMIIVANPNILSITDALKTIKLAEQMQKPVRGVIITRVKDNQAEMSISSIKEMLEIPILGIIPEDQHIELALMKKNAVIHTKPKSKSAKAYRDIAAKLLGKRKLSEPFYKKILEAIGF